VEGKLGAHFALTLAAVGRPCCEKEVTPFGVLRQALRQVAGTTNFEHGLVFLEELSKPDYVDVTRLDARHLLQDMYTICLGCF
jgi:hypothetical protein